ncbi:hypothetical protein ACIBL3_04565 [Kribbella sp. NPDC050124]|uniref:hypothetical protein n=1 Tax=Kribbella sp. NPDC050124 TaxID=3364114 RepID=UPI00379E006C
MRTTYRMRAGRFVGIPAAGLILLGVAAILWAIGLPDAVVVVFLVLGGMVLLGGLSVLARPPVVLKLRDDGIEVRGLRTAWTDVTAVGRVETTHGEAIVLRTQEKEHSVLVPIGWLAPGQTESLENALRDRLNKAHGYTIWDGTAPDDADPAE